MIVARLQRYPLFFATLNCTVCTIKLKSAYQQVNADGQSTLPKKDKTLEKRDNAENFQLLQIKQLLVPMAAQTVRREKRRGPQSTLE